MKLLNVQSTLSKFFKGCLPQNLLSPSLEYFVSFERICNRNHSQILYILPPYYQVGKIVFSFDVELSNLQQWK